MVGGGGRNGDLCEVTRLPGKLCYFGEKVSNRRLLCLDS
jgi:hypothetical protein